MNTLLTLQRHIKHDPNDYTCQPPPLPLPFKVHFPASTGEWKALYTFAVVINVYIEGFEEGALKEGGGSSNPSQKDPFISLGHGWLGCLHQTSHWSCGCYKI